MNKDEKQVEIVAGLIEAMDKGFRPKIHNDYIKIHGWGFDLMISIESKTGQIQGFIDDTSGG